MPRNRIAIIMNLQRRKQLLLIDEVGVGQKTAYNWMSNRTQPNIFQLKKISGLLGVSMEELIED